MMIQYNNLDSSMDARDHFKNGVKSHTSIENKHNVSFKLIFLQ